MTDPCRFDDGIPRLLTALATQLAPEQISAGVVLRDAAGCLSFFSSQELSPEHRDALESLLRAHLGAYARPDRVLVGPDDPGAQRMLNDPYALELTGNDTRQRFRYLDRRIVGSDWMRQPSPTPTAADTPNGARAARRVAFASLKGGVGRSTALTIVAAEQARKGRNVLVIDLDLEAPGIGSLLLSEDRMPQFGVIDFLVERNFGSVDRAVVDDMIGTSALTQGQGLVDVVPAIGTRTLEQPANYLAKLSRAMIEAVPEQGPPSSLADKLHDMLTALEAVRRYDLVLLDVRAGLAEVTAGPLLSLETEVLIFGADQRQTIQDLRFLLAHLGSLTGDSNPDEWSRLKMVHAKATASRVAGFRDDVWNLFASYLYVEAVALEQFNFDADAIEAPHYPLVIPLDTAFADWDPVSHPDKLVESFYAHTFDSLLRYVDEVLLEAGDAV